MNIALLLLYFYFIGVNSIFDSGSNHNEFFPIMASHYPIQKKVMRIENGDVFEGEWENHSKKGVGAYHYSDGECDISMYENDKRVGKSVRWSTDRRKIFALNERNQASKKLSVNEAQDILVDLGVDILL